MQKIISKNIYSLTNYLCKKKARKLTQCDLEIRQLTVLVHENPIIGMLNRD